MSLRRMHVFDSRQEAFRDDKVLQENVIVYAVKEKVQARFVTITSSDGVESDDIIIHDVPHRQVVYPGDPQSFIRIVTDEIESRVAERMARFTTRLADLGLMVSTGRVVDFRADEHLHWEPAKGTAPLIYPTHFQGGWHQLAEDERQEA